jgi:hypothetical protein
MRNISKSIFEILELKFIHHSKVVMTKDDEKFNGVKYSFEKDGDSYSAIFQTYSTGGTTYTIEKNNEHINSKTEILAVLELAKKIFIPTNPDL